jgi:hypothetical protein
MLEFKSFPGRRPDCRETQMNRLVAARLQTPLDDHGLPDASSWAKAAPVHFCSDWCARNPDQERLTEVRTLWSAESIYLRFDCRFREIFTYEGGNTRRDKLWMRDVAEVFIRPGTWEPNHYLEFETSPNGDWLDLDISPGQKSILCLDLKSRVTRVLERQTWTAEIAIPISCFTEAFDPGHEWRLNLFRIEGREPDRFYSSWIPTHTPQPNFHIPGVFGILQFA